MYVIFVYDISTKRGAKVLKVLRRYLNWVQNSVFEGDLSESQLMSLKADISKIIKENKDSVVYYIFENRQYIERGVIGKEKGNVDNFV